MGLRFSRRITIMPGLRLNLGMNGASLSVGPRGASVTVGSRGAHASVGIPGTGLSYCQRLDRGTPQPAVGGASPSPPERIRLRFEGPALTILDGEGTPIDEPLLAATRKAYRAQILDALRSRAAVLNGESVRLADVHIDTPAPAVSSVRPPFASPKPARPADPRAPGLSPAETAARAGRWADYMEALALWRAARAEHDKTVAAATRAIDPASVERALARLAWPRETHISFESIDDGRVVLADVDLPEIEEMPNELFVVRARDLVISATMQSERAVRRAYLRHVHGVLFRIVGAIFAAAPATAEVRIAGYTQRRSPTTGAIDDVYILAVHVDRARWQSIDFAGLSALDPVGALACFDRRCSVDGRGAMQPIQPSSLGS